MKQNNTETITLNSIGKSFSMDEDNQMYLNGESIAEWSVAQTKEAFKGLSHSDAELMDKTFKVDFYDLTAKSK